MSSVQELHTDAMNIAEEAFVAKLRGNTGEAQTLLRSAFEKEQAAANLLAKDLKFEPSRSIIHRSAASLAIDCGKLREAERLIATALSGDPPLEIADELRVLLEQVYFQRHLEMRGITLAEDEFQLSIAGRAIGYGMALSEQFVSRVQTLEKLIFRTAERLAKKPFREKGPPKKLLREGLDLFISAPKAGSFAVNFRMGYHKEQQVLPGLTIVLQ